MTPRDDSIPLEVLGELEQSLDRTPMFGASLGGVLNDVVIIDLIHGHGRWSAARRFRWLLGEWRLRRRGAFRPPLPPAAPSGSILVTWRQSTSRLDELLIPVIEALGPQRCTVLYQKKTVLTRVPPGAKLLQLSALAPHEPGVWRPEFRRCWPSWRTALKSVCRRFRLPAGAHQLLALELIAGSQLFVGCRQFLRAFRPSAIVTEYDRCFPWSCLVLAAKSIAIPTFVLQHGVISERAFGCLPLLADKMFCWGTSTREIMLRCGAPAEQILVGGCPRLDRELSVSAREGRAKLGLDPAKPVVMLATAPYAEAERVRLVEMFAACMERLPEAVGIVRLHPSEKLKDSRALAAAHPAIHFFDNGAATLDETLAAAEVVVVQSSGVGSDALVKGRAAIVVDIPPAPLGHGKELVESAGCPLVKTEEELARSVAAMLFDKEQRKRQTAAAEAFVQRFCAYFGRESAKEIAEAVGRAALPATPKYHTAPQRS